MRKVAPPGKHALKRATCGGGAWHPARRGPRAWLRSGSAP